MGDILWHHVHACLTRPGGSIDPFLSPSPPPMEQRLFLLDGMALAYRAHFALIGAPDPHLDRRQHVGAVRLHQHAARPHRERRSRRTSPSCSTPPLPPPRHDAYPEYKAHREDMPEDLAAALPTSPLHSRPSTSRCCACDGYEADDIIGTSRDAPSRPGFTTYMVTPDKDFGQLVDEQHRYLQARHAGRGAGNPRRARGLRPLGHRTRRPGDRHARPDGRRQRQHPGRAGVGEKTA